MFLNVTVQMKGINHREGRIVPKTVKLLLAERFLEIEHYL